MATTASATLDHSNTCDYTKAQRAHDLSPYHIWLRNARPGSIFLDREDRLYLMAGQDVRRIEDPQIAEALVLRDRMLRTRIQRVQRIIRYQFGAIGLLSLALIAALTLPLILT